MIRGIILLILSCVVLSMATQDYCTCNANTRPVYEQVAEYYPSETVESIDYTEKPNTCEDVRIFTERVSAPNDAFIRETSTLEIGNLITGVNGLLRTVTGTIENLVLTLTTLLREITVVEAVLGNRLDNILNSLLVCQQPTCAVPIVEDILEILTRTLQLNHAKEVVTERLNSETVRKELLLQENKILSDYATVSRTIDSKASSCTSGGLLTGLLGGSCSHNSLLDQVLGGVIGGVVGGILRPVFGILRNLLATININIANLTSALNIHLDLLLAKLGIYVDISNLDVMITLNDFHFNLKDKLTLLQNRASVPIEEVHSTMADITSDNAKTEQFLELISLPLTRRGILADTLRLTCTGISVNVLGVVQVDLQLPSILCTITGKLNIIPNVNVANIATVDLRGAAKEFVEISRVVSMGTTGCHQATANLVSLDVLTGLFESTFELVNLENLLEIPAPILEGLNIDDIVSEGLSEVTGLVDFVLHQPSSLVANLADEQSGLVSELLEEVALLNPILDILLGATQDRRATFIAAKENSIEKILSSNNVAEIANEAVSVLTDEKTRTIEEYTCAFKNLERAVLMAEATIANEQKQILEIRAQLALNPDDKILLGILAGLEVRIQASLSAAVHIKLLATKIIADLDLHIGLFQGELADIAARLNVNIGSLKAGIITVAAELNIKLSDVLQLENFQLDLNNLIKVLRGTIESIELHVLGLDVDGLLKMVLGINDPNKDGLSVQELTHVHEKIIKSAVGACACNDNIEVYETPSYKRSTGTTYEYTVVISDGPTSSSATVDRATEETGMTATTATTSSASSLVFSFFILFVSVLCFF